MRATDLIRLYPRAWRERYGEEFHELVASHTAGPRLIFDILIGALDARLAPQPQVAESAKGAVPGGRVMEILKSSCGAPPVSRSEALKQAVLIVAVTLAVALLAVWLKRQVGENVWVEALLASTASIAPLLYLPFLMRAHPVRTRVALVLVLFGFVYAIGVLSAFI